MSRRWPALFAVAVVLFAGGHALAGKFNKVLSVGDKAPEWKDLTGTDDKTYGLNDFKDAKVLVQIVTCNACPVAVAYEDRMIRLQKDYSDKGVKLVAINVNNNDANKMDKMKERATSKGFNFPYLYDPTQKMAHDYGATVTPHVFVTDKTGKLIYTGAIDDNMDESKVTKHYLKDAIEAALSGQPIETAETKQFGCGIKFE